MTKRLKAITLMETLVYISIFGMFMLILIQFFLSIQFNQDKIYKELELEMNQIFITNHLKEAVGENFAFMQEGDSGIFFNEEKTFEYKIFSNDFIVLEDGVVQNLSNSKALVTDFVIEPIGYNSAVRLKISLAHSGNENITREFSNLIKLVNYEQEEQE